MLAFDPIGPHLDSVAEDWSAGVDHGAAWPAKLVSAKHHAVEACWKIVDKALEDFFAFQEQQAASTKAASTQATTQTVAAPPAPAAAAAGDLK